MGRQADRGIVGRNFFLRGERVQYRPESGGFQSQLSPEILERHALSQRERPVKIRQRFYRRCDQRFPA